MNIMDLTYHTTFPEALRDEWNALLDESVSHVPFLRYDYLEAWWRHRGGGEWPDAELAVVTARQDGRLIGIAPLFFTPNHDGHPALMLLGSIEISDYLDLIVRPADLTAFLDALIPFLSQPDRPAWQTLDLYNLLDSSAHAAGARSGCAAAWADLSPGTVAAFALHSAARRLGNLSVLHRQKTAPRDPPQDAPR